MKLVKTTSASKLDTIITTKLFFSNMCVLLWVITIENPMVFATVSSGVLWGG